MIKFKNFKNVNVLYFSKTGLTNISLIDDLLTEKLTEIEFINNDFI